VNDDRIDRKLAIACESGGFRCVFVHGALDALEEATVRAGTYAAASASVLPAAFAAIGRAREPGLAYWRVALAVRRAEGNGMSDMVLAGLERYAPIVSASLFDPGGPRFMIVASDVVDDASAEKTQGMLASRLGREQLLAMARGDDSWARAALQATLFDSRARDDRRLTRENLAEVAYASSRMLHAWRVPATIDGRPYIDASYTVGFPVVECGDGVARIVAIATGPGEPYRNLYRTATIPRSVGAAAVDIIAPLMDLKELGVDFTSASEQGLARGYEHGREMARRWLASTASAKNDRR
jgi:hypothetical protein